MISWLGTKLLLFLLFEGSVKHQRDFTQFYFIQTSIKWIECIKGIK